VLSYDKTSANSRHYVITLTNRAPETEIAPSTGPCIYCSSTVPATKREHVMSRAVGTFEQNWTLDCVCDECNQYFADNLELPLGRDSREALLRIDLGLKPAAAAAQLLNRRVKTSLRDPGQFDGIRVLLRPSEDGTETIPVPVPQVGLRREGDTWRFLTERELTAENTQEFKESSALEVRIYGVGADCDRLKQRLIDLGIEFVETHRTRNQPIMEQSALTVVYDINVDETIVRAACKIAFNYAAKVLGPETVRDARFDAARRFVRLWRCSRSPSDCPAFVGARRSRGRLSKGSRLWPRMGPRLPRRVGEPVQRDHIRDSSMRCRIDRISHGAAFL
jgi:hypothetical protein